MIFISYIIVWHIFYWLIPKSTIIEGGGGGTPDVTCDISCLANQLWDNDINRVQVWEYEINHQGQTTTSSTSDQAAQRYTGRSKLHSQAARRYKFRPLKGTYIVKTLNGTQSGCTIVQSRVAHRYKARPLKGTKFIILFNLYTHIKFWLCVINL